jgi:aspartyl-tRNA(Asn)/glutamyl-tRNA(Gln) amidotransferase subunit A
MQAGQAVRDTEQYLDVIARLNPKLNAVLTVTADMAMEQAKAADRAAADGEWLGILHGVPMLVKDCLNVAGVRTTFGSSLYRDNISSSDSAVVEKARKSGPVYLGKTNLAEFCYGATTQNAHFGDCVNPWDPRRVSGGSSGGAGSAAASGMCRIAFGSDTGGSIRNPAALCGVAGIRPTVGAVPNTNALALSIHADTIGMLAYNVSDVARGYAAIAGYDPEDVGSIDRPVGNFLPTLHDGVEGVRIGIPRSFYFDDLQPDIGDRVMDAARVLERLGAVLVDMDLEGAEEARVATMAVLLATDMADLHRDEVVNHADQIGAEVLRRLRLGEPVTGTEYAHALRIQVRWKHQMKKVFQNVDAMLVPTCPVVAPMITNAADMVKTTHNISRNNTALGYAGLPCLTVPVGFNFEGMPIGMQLVATWFNEPLAFRAGVAYQSRTEFHRMRPKLSG